MNEEDEGLLNENMDMRENNLPHLPPPPPLSPIASLAETITNNNPTPSTQATSQFPNLPNNQLYLFWSCPRMAKGEEMEDRRG